MKRFALNQVGYCADMPKTAVYLGTAGDFRIIDAASGKAVFSGRAGKPVADKASSDTVSLIDFSEFTACGSYYIRVGTRKSSVFTISEKPYEALTKALLKGIYCNRCSELDSRFAGEYAHGKCHRDLAALFSSSSKRTDVSGGWHISGSYAKYTVGTCLTLAHLMYAYRLFPESFTFMTGIPESGSSTPDILCECRYGLEWLLKMQTRDGGVYHKVSAVSGVGIVMPDKDTSEYFIFGKSHQATAAFCAATAFAARVFARFDKLFSKALEEASLNAWIWLMNNPVYEPFENPPTVIPTLAGDFYDKTIDNKIFWAACELYELTGDEAFHSKITELCGRVTGTGLSNADNSGFGTVSYLFGKQPTDPQTEKLLKERIREKADYLCALSRESGYGTAKTEKDYLLGSNMYAMTDSIILSLAHILFGKEEYLGVICGQLDYILGKNPLGKCYVTGFGTDTVKHPHHRQSEADDVDEPVPGLLVTGPNSLATDNVLKWYIPPGSPAAKCYCDMIYTFSTNEPTIFSNSAAVFVTGYIGSKLVRK